MTVLHVENNATTRGALERLLQVEDGKFRDNEYLATAITVTAKNKLQAGVVKALVLDLGLNTRWDNQHMIEVLRHLALGEPPPNQQALGECDAFSIAQLAQQHDVPCALLTNYADYLGGNPPLTEAQLRNAFFAEAVFHKNEEGMQQCASWVREKVT